MGASGVGACGFWRLRQLLLSTSHTVATVKNVRDGVNSDRRLGIRA